MKYLIAAMVFSSCGLAYAGYSVFTTPQVTPQYVTVHGADGPELRLNPGGEVIKPVTYGRLICKASPFSQYSTAENRRQEVYENTVGVATDAEVLSVCTGLKRDITEQIKDIRKQALDRIALAAGVLAVYSENYAAAKAYKDGLGASTIMKDGQTAAVYLSGFGAQLGMSASQFADYIIAENRRVGPTAYEVEQQYLWFAYTAVPTENRVDVLLDIPNQYRRYCGL